MAYFLHVFHEILYRPIFNALIFFYTHFSFGDLGIAIILLTVFIRLVLFPLFYKGAKDQAIIQRLAPRVKELQKIHKGNREAHAKALMDLYREHKINPLSGFLLLLVQLPILIALYQVFIRSLNGSKLIGLYSFVPSPGVINPVFLHFINLAHTNIVMAVVAGALQYWQSKLMFPSKATADPTAKMMQYQTLYFLPAVTILLGIRFPAGLTLYWVITNLFGIGQQYYILRKEEEVVEEVIDASK